MQGGVEARWSGQMAYGRARNPALRTGSRAHSRTRVADRGVRQTPRRAIPRQHGDGRAPYAMPVCSPILPEACVRSDRGLGVGVSGGEGVEVREGEVAGAVGAVGRLFLAFDDGESGVADGVAVGDAVEVEEEGVEFGAEAEAAVFVPGEARQLTPRPPPIPGTRALRTGRGPRPSGGETLSRSARNGLLGCRSWPPEKLDGGCILLHAGRVFSRSVAGHSEAKWMAMGEEAPRLEGD